jgi:HD-GYP domain-containing protein (c-di-GMP phosphodiesterase class II)
MYVAGLDRSWVTTPFFRHRFLLKTQTQVDRIRLSGAQEVTIDTEQGVDVDQVPGNDHPADHSSDHTTSLEGNAPVSGSGGVGTLAEEFSHVRQIRQDMLGSVRAVFASVRTSGTVDRGQVLELSEKMIADILKHHEAFLAMVRVREYDPALCEHELAVATLALIMGKSLDFTPTQIQRLAVGSLMHDIGLLRVPVNLLHKRRALSPQERVLYGRHSALGVALLEKSGGFDAEVLMIVQDHHVSLDNDGQPLGGTGAGITKAGRIVQIVDVYDELLTGQGDTTALPPPDALAHLYRNAQRYGLDQELVSQLISQVGVYPLFSLVALNTGERAIVTRVSPGKLLEPMVVVIADSGGAQLSQPVGLDLSAQDPSQPRRSIRCLLDPDREGIAIEDCLARLDRSPCVTR